MLQALNNQSDDDKRRLKLLLRDNEAERTKYATSLATRFLKDSLVAAPAEIARALTTLEAWYLA